PPSTPPSSPAVVLVSWTWGAAFSILTGWTMSLTLILCGSMTCTFGFAPPLGGGGGGGGGGATARSVETFGRSSISMSQIVFTHIVKKIRKWRPTTPIRSGGAHFGILRL